MKEIRIILIDDDSASRVRMARYLRQVTQLKVKEFRFGSKAIDFIAEHADQYTAVVLDLLLDPEMSGQEVMESIRTNHPELPVIIFTGQDPQGGREAYTRGAYAYFQQPVELPNLINVIYDIAAQRDIYARIAHDVRTVLQSESCVAWKLERSTQQFRIAAAVGSLQPDYMRDALLDVSAALSTWPEAFVKGAPIFLSDLSVPQQSPYYQHQTAARRHGWKSLISVPLVFQGRLTGFVNSYTKKRPDFLEKNQWVMTKRMLKAMAARSAEAIRSADLTYRYQVIQDIDQTLAGTLDEQTILDQILAKAVNLVDVKIGWLYLVDLHSQNLVRKSTWGINPNRLDAERSFDNGIMGKVATDGIAYRMADTDNDSNHKPMGNISVVSELAVPLRQGKQTIGVLAVVSRHKDYFTNDDVDQMTTLSTLAAITINRAKLTGHVKELSQKVVQGMCVDDLLQYIVLAVRDLTFNDVNLWMISSRADEGNRYLRIASHSPEIDPLFVRDARLSTDPKKSICGLALYSGQTQIRGDILHDDKQSAFQYSDIARKQGWRAFMAIPMIGGDGEQIGVITVYGKTPRQFTIADAEPVRVLANQAAIAYQQRHHAASLEQLTNTVYKLTQGVTIRPENVLHEIVEEICKITGADCAVLYPYDPDRHDSYAQNHVVSYGLKEKKALIDKPRKAGLAATVRNANVLVARDVQRGLIDRGDKQLPFNEQERNWIVESINNSSFIRREGIKAFVGISLKTATTDAENGDAAQEVGVLYLNFRRPYDFTSADLQIIRIYDSVGERL